MHWQTILGVALLTLVYGGIMAGLVWVLSRAGVPARWTIALGFVSFGVVSGLLAAWAWPYDSCVLPNLWAVLLGDVLYRWASPGPGSPVALAVPWFYPLAGVILYGALGLVVQVIANGWRVRRTGRKEGGSIQA
jgi:hypothetical protein